MATSFQALVALTTAIVAASQTCVTETNGHCTFLSCYGYRGPTDCVGSFPTKVCACKPGFCTKDKETCVDPNAIPEQTDFKKGDRVEVQDREKDVPLPGTVTNPSPLEVQVDGSKQSFAWKIVKHKAPTFKKGDQVEARDSSSNDWKQGTVTSVGNKVMVQPDGWKTSFAFEQIRPVNYEQIAKDAVVAHEKAKGDFATALKQEVIFAAAAKKASGEATSAYNEAANQAADAKKAADDVGLRLKKAEATESQKKKEEADANALVKEAEAKQDAAHQATVGVEKESNNAAALANKRADASEAAKTLAASKKTLVQGVQAQEKQDNDAIAKTCGEQSNPALARAMAAACASAKGALNTTKKLLTAYEDAQAKADSEATQAAAASVKAKNDAAEKSKAAATAAHDEDQQKSNTQAAQGVAAAAKQAADSAMAAEKEAADEASAAKKNADNAAAKAKEAAATQDHNQKVFTEASRKAEDTGRKSKAIFSASSLSLAAEFVLFQKTGPSNYDQRYVSAAATGFIAALVMFATMMWRSIRLGGNVVLPEELLG